MFVLILVYSLTIYFLFVVSDYLVFLCSDIIKQTNLKENLAVPVKINRALPNL